MIDEIATPAGAARTPAHRPARRPRPGRRLAGTQGPWRLGVALALALLLAACGPLEPPGGGSLQETILEAGTRVDVDGVVLIAQPDAFAGAVAVSIEAVDDPSPDAPLPAGVTSLGPAARIAAASSMQVAPDRPLIVGLPVPDGTDPAGLAIAFLEPHGVYAPPDADTDTDAAGPSWVILEGALLEDEGLVLAPVLALHPTGWVALLVRAEGFDTPPVMPENEVVETAAHLAFLGWCAAAFESAPETCDAADRALAAAMLSDAYHELTAFGFTTTPHLRRAQLFVISFQPPFIRTVPGPYLIELRPRSQEIAGGMYSSGTGNIWIAYTVAGFGEPRRPVVRHEYVHATQNAYGVPFASTQAWLDARWIEEGQAVILEGGYGPMVRSPRNVRAVDDSLLRSMWTGRAWGPTPPSEYDAQDFWVYLANRFGHADASFLEPFMRAGRRATNVDATLRSAYPQAFGGSGNDGGLAAAYWAWVKNQVFQKQVPMSSTSFGTTCAFTFGSATPELVAYAPGTPVAPLSFTLDPLSSKVVRVDFATPTTVSYAAHLQLSPSSSSVRSTVFRSGQAGTSACFDQPDTSSATIEVGGAGQRAFVVVSNTSATAAASFDLGFPSVTITAPTGGVDEGPVSFAATTSLSGPNVAIHWTRTPVGGGTPFFFGPTASGETITQTLCDGTYDIVAEARQGISGPRVSQTLRLQVADLGATNPPAACAPLVRILEPAGGGTFSADAPLTLRAETETKGTATYPVQWRTGSVSGPIVATGATTSATFAAGSVSLFVTFGSASDAVTFSVAPGTPPTARITSPADGATFYWYDDTSNLSGLAVAFTGTGTSGAGAALPVSSLAWSSRRSGQPNWTDHGSGSSKSIFFPYGGAAVSQAYEVRLTATDANGLVGSQTITIWIVRPPD